MTTTKATKANEKAKRIHAERFQDGCSWAWSTMCEDCCARLGGQFEVHPAVKEFNHIRITTRHLKTILDAANTTLAKFRASLDDDPFNAMEWGMSAMEAAAKKHVAEYLLEVIELNGINTSFKIAQEEALRGARWPTHSTSPTANIMSQAKTAAFAEFVSHELEYKVFA